MSEEPYGARARALVSELIGAETLPAHADEAVRRVLAETASLSAELESLAAERAELAAAGLAGAAGEDGGEALAGLAVPLVVFEATLRRNKRCLLAYAARRCDLLDDLRWAYGAAGLPPELRDKMSSAEADYCACDCSPRCTHGGTSAQAPRCDHLHFLSPAHPLLPMSRAQTMPTVLCCRSTRRRRGSTFLR